MVKTFVSPSHGAQRMSPNSDHPETQTSPIGLPIRELEMSVTKMKIAALEQDITIFDYHQPIIANNINKETAINILMFLDKEEVLSAKPSAPPESSSVESKTKLYLLDKIEDLRNVCLNVIDSNVHDVLTDNVLPMLPYDILHEILSRDSLNNPREDLLLDYIWRWGYIRCKDTMQMRCTVRNLPYTIRYGLMSWSSFKRLKPDISILLEIEDYKKVKSYLQQRKKGLEVTTLPNNWSNTRENQTDHSYGEDEPPANCFIKCCVGWAFLFD